MPKKKKKKTSMKKKKKTTTIKKFGKDGRLKKLTKINAG